MSHSPASNPAYVLPETTLLVVIGGLDLLSTVYLLATGKAHEANPLFAGLLNTVGVLGFILFKALMLAVPLTIAELARRRHPEFVRTALRIGIAAYVVLYLAAYLRFNLH